MSAAMAIAITGLGLELPGLGDAAGLLEYRPPPETPAFDPARKLGRKGLLYKDQATRLALCAVQDALQSAGLPIRQPHAEAPTGVVASSNFGNLDTVCRVVDVLKAGRAADLSPMDVPNASSNVVASSIAIRFGCRAANLMLCSGAASGTEALFVAANVLRMGRAERMLVVGVEPDNEFVRQLAAASRQPEPQPEPQGHARLRLGAGAACVVLEPLAAARRRGAKAYGVVDGYASFGPGDVPRVAPDRPDLWLMPNQAWPEMHALTARLHDAWGGAPPGIDLSEALGELSGALGVFQGVAAALWLARRDADARGLRVLMASGGSWGDGVASLAVSQPPVEP